MSGREVSRRYLNIVFMFLFLIPFTIRQHCIIYPQEFSTEPVMGFKWIKWMFFCGEVGVDGLWIGFVEGGGFVFVG